MIDRPSQSRPKGRIRSIHICGDAGAPMQSLPDVRALENRGLEGDRYLKGLGTYSKKPGADRQVTLIESEALRDLAMECGTLLAPAESRRNLVTEGIALNPLVGQTFRVGEVTLKGERLCEPCGYLAELTGKDVFQPMVGRGGLRARILVGGTIRVGDPIEAAEPAAEPVAATPAGQRRG